MKIGVALSGGGIRGIAHAGVLKALKLWYSCQHNSFSKDPAIKTIFELSGQVFC